MFELAWHLGKRYAVAFACVLLLAAIAIGGGPRAAASLARSLHAPLVGDIAVALAVALLAALARARDRPRGLSLRRRDRLRRGRELLRPLVPGALRARPAQGCEGAHHRGADQGLPTPSTTMSARSPSCSGPRARSARSRSTSRAPSGASTRSTARTLLQLGKAAQRAKLLPLAQKLFAQIIEKSRTPTRRRSRRRRGVKARARGVRGVGSRRTRPTCRWPGPWSTASSRSPARTRSARATSRRAVKLGKDAGHRHRADGAARARCSSRARAARRTRRRACRPSRRSRRRCRGIIAAEAPPDEEPPAPIAISIRAVTVVEEPVPVPVPSPSPSPREAHARGGDRRRGAGVLGVIAFFLLRSDGASDDGLDRVLDMRAEFPTGWRLVPSPPKTAHAIHGDDAEAFVAFVAPTRTISSRSRSRPRPVPPASCSPARPPIYSEGCEAQDPPRSDLPRHREDAAGEVLTLQTFIRAKDQRAVLALFLAKPSVEDREQLAAAIVDSLGI